MVITKEAAPLVNTIARLLRIERLADMAYDMEDLYKDGVIGISAPSMSIECKGPYVHLTKEAFNALFHGKFTWASHPAGFNYIRYSCRYRGVDFMYIERIKDGDEDA